VFKQPTKYEMSHMANTLCH